MKLKNIDEVNEFLSVIDTCEGNVYLTSPYGDRYNLKSKLAQFVAIAALIGEKGNELELFCDTKADENKLVKFFDKNPQTL